MRPALPAVILLLAGCVPSNVKTLEAEGVATTLASPLQWEEAYRRVNAQAQRCWSPAGLFGASSMKVDGQLYGERRMGEITLTFPKGPFSSVNGPLVRVQVSPQGDGAAVVVLAKSGIWARQAPKSVAAWLDGVDDCRP